MILGARVVILNCQKGARVDDAGRSDARHGSASQIEAGYVGSLPTLLSGDRQRWLKYAVYDIGRLVRNAEAGGFRGVYSVELWATPAPKDTDRAVRSFIKTITDNMR